MIIALLSFCICSCNSIQEKGNHIKDDTLRAPMGILNASSGDSMILKAELNIEPKVYISILPSDRWLDSMQRIYAEEDWNEVVFDNQHYIYQAEIYLKSKGYVEIAAPEDKIWSIRRPNRVKIIHSDTLADKWGIILFNGNNDPIFYDGTEPEIDLAAF